MVRSEVEESTTTVLETNKQAPTKVKVHYGKVEETVAEGGPPATTVKPISGKGYVAAPDGGQVKVTRVDKLGEKVAQSRAPFRIVARP